MPKLGALTKISKQAVERAENFTSGRNRLRGGPPLTRSALLPVALQSLIEMALNTNLAVRHTLRSSLEDKKEEAIEYVPPLAVSQNTSTMTRLVELRDTMIWILNTEFLINKRWRESMLLKVMAQLGQLPRQRK